MKKAKAVRSNHPNRLRERLRKQWVLSDPAEARRRVHTAWRGYLHQLGVGPEKDRMVCQALCRVLVVAEAVERITGVRMGGISHDELEVFDGEKAV